MNTNLRCGTGRQTRLTFFQRRLSVACSLTFVSGKTRALKDETSLAALRLKTSASIYALYASVYVGMETLQGSHSPTRLDSIMSKNRTASYNGSRCESPKGSDRGSTCREVTNSVVHPLREPPRILRGGVERLTEAREQDMQRIIRIWEDLKRESRLVCDISESNTV